MCRARKELSNGAFLAKFGVDTAENELSKVQPACLPRTRPSDSNKQLWARERPQPHVEYGAEDPQVGKNVAKRRKEEV